MMFTSSRSFVAAAGAAAALALTGPLLAAAPAVAAPARPYGTVVSPTGINERALPTTNSRVLGTLPYRAQVGLRCKVRGQNIDGNNLWYQLRQRVQGQEAWVAARYVQNTGFVSFCTSSPRLSQGQLTAVHQGPLG